MFLIPMKLELTNISKSFPGIKALNNVNFYLKQNSVHGLIGENGAGKSTLVKILCGVYQPEEGKIKIVENILFLHFLVPRNRSSSS